MNYPEIRFKNPQLLLESIRPDIGQSYQHDDRLHELDIDYLQRKVEEYESVWRPHEHRILTELCNILQLEFYQNTIDVYVAPFRNSFSDPLFLATKLGAERAVEVLTHELTHRLLSDNTLCVDTVARHSEWQKLFGTDHTKITLEHIPVHATLSALYIDQLGRSDQVTSDKQRSQNWGDYAASWWYVDKMGYQKILEMLRESYKRLS